MVQFLSTLTDKVTTLQIKTIVGLDVVIIFMFLLATQGPSRKNDEAVLKGLPFDPNYMTRRHYDRKDLVKTKM